MVDGRTPLPDGAEPLFPADAAIRRIAAEGLLLLGGGRALLLQLAHPSVARGVADHSNFADDPFDRLFRTLAATYTIVFGTREEAARVAAGVRRVHDHVTGEGYQANDPELLMWVHATLVDSSLVAHRHFMGRLDAAVEAEFYEQSKVIAALYGCPVDRQPVDLATFRAYRRHMVRTLTVSDTARRLADDVLHARLPLPLGLGMPVVRHVTIGLLPRPIRRQYGLRFGARQRAAFVAASKASSAVVPKLPRTVRSLPVRYFARRGT